MPTIDEELIQNAMAVFHGKVEHSEDVTFGKNAEVDGKLTINSASDLKTKDGSSIGGGGLSQPWFSSNEYIGVKSKSNPSAQVEDFVSGLYNIDGIIGLLAQNIITGVVVTIIPTASSDAPLFLYQYDDVNSMITLPESFFTQSTEINLGDIVNKQATLYRHTVTIWNNNNASLIFTAESEKNTVIDSIQDLVDAFGNTKLACSGMKWETASSIIHIMRLDVGTSISDTNVYTGRSEDGSFGEETFTDIFGATGLIITDNVTAM